MPASLTRKHLIHEPGFVRRLLLNLVTIGAMVFLFWKVDATREAALEVFACFIQNLMAGEFAQDSDS